MLYFSHCEKENLVILMMRVRQEYLIECFTEEKDVCLDQFGGSCNVAEAAIKANRFAVVYELCSDFVKKAVNRLGAINASTIAAAE